MKEISRRAFVGRAIAVGAASAVLAEAAPAQLVWQKSEWKIAEFEQLVNNPARIKQVYDVKQIDGGRFLNNVKNSLNGLRFGFGVPKAQIKIAVGMHGPANMLNYDDYIWNKYRIGEWLSVADSATGKPAVTNPFYKSKGVPENEPASTDPDNEGSMYQETSIQTLQSRGVQFLSCHTATEEQARALIRRNKLSQSPEDVVKDMLAHTVPGVLVVAAMVAAIALLQAEGRYTYITV